MSTLLWSIVSAGSAGIGWNTLWNYDPAKERRRAVVQDANIFGWRERIRAKLVSSAQRERLSVIGVSEAKYQKDLLGAMVLGFAAGWIGLHQWLFGVMAAGVGYGLVWLRAAGRYGRWQKEVVTAMQDLVRLLKLRMLAGEKASVAVERAEPFLSGALAVEWRRMLAQIHAGASLEEALDSLANRIDDRNFTAVLTRLRTYHRTGVPEQPFGDMAEHLSRVYMIQQSGRMRRLTAPLTWYALGGFLGAFTISLLPQIIVQVLQALQGTVIF